MRIVQLCEFDRPRAGSFVPAMAAVCEHAAARGHDARVLLPEGAAGRPWISELTRRGVAVDFTPAKGRRSQVVWLEAAYPDDSETVLHTHFTTWDIAAAVLARRRSRTHAVWHVHTVLPRSPAVSMRTAVKLAVFGRWVTAILCPSEEVAAGVRRRLAPRGRVAIVPSAIDPRIFPLLDRPSRLEARAKLGLPLDSPVLLHFGRDWKVKGVDVFVRAMAELRQRLGDGAVGLSLGGDERASELARDLGVGDALIVSRPIEDVVDAYAAADGTIASSRAEGLPYTVLESLSTGTPVVATDIPGHRLVAERVDACVIVPPDPKLIAAAAEELLARSPAETAKQAHLAHEQVSAAFGVDGFAERLVDLYESAALGAHLRTDD